ncbi:hypothetical protein [Bradyrhizobium sp. LMG 9283]|uniref:hypothetical protein n=1 Tax=Bradyrhizobium sp. LMG 9283 TaxID=592064 RepID=UPI00388D41BE
MANDAEQSADQGKIRVAWEPAIDPDAPAELARLWAQIPVAEVVFDQLFNGRSGYRAQFYLSPGDGLIFNRAIVDTLMPAIKLAYTITPLPVPLKVVEHSIRAAHSKIWLFEDKDAFDRAPENILNPPRWVANRATRGRRIPLPPHLSIDVKGTFINPAIGKPWVHEYKLDRAEDLHANGFA